MSVELLYHLVAIAGAACILVSIAKRWLAWYKSRGKPGQGVAFVVLWGVATALIGTALAYLLFVVFGGGQ